MHRAIASAALACFLMAAGAAAAQTKPEQPPKPAPPTTKPDQPGKPAEVNPSAAKPAVSGDKCVHHAGGH